MSPTILRNKGTPNRPVSCRQQEALRCAEIHMMSFSQMIYFKRDSNYYYELYFWPPPLKPVTRFLIPHPPLKLLRMPTEVVRTLEPWHHWWAAGTRRDSSPTAFGTWHSHSGGTAVLHPWGHAASSFWGHTGQLMPLHWWRRASETLGGHCWSTWQQTL